MALRIAIAQVAAVVGSPVENTATVVCVVQEHAGKADLVVFPELFIPGYFTPETATASAPTPSHVADCCEPVDGAAFLAISEAARAARVGVIYGFGEQDGDQR
jgi:predicted amidohydrolase